MPQLQINQGPQDALLYDNSKSYFKQIGYSRTSNFQIEYRDVDPANQAALGSTVQFVMPKCADLLGPVDLLLDFETLEDSVVNALKHESTGSFNHYGWVESLGFAMIDHVTFSVGSHECERITGDQLYIANELMRTEEQRLSAEHILKTGRPLIEYQVGENSATPPAAYIMPIGNITDTALQAQSNGSRLICVVGSRDVSHTYSSTSNDNASKVLKGKQLIVPLSLFFTKAPSQYFPMCAIAGSHDVRIQIKLRPLSELLIVKPGYTMDTASAESGRLEAIGSGAVDMTTVANNPKALGHVGIKSCQLRCSYVHVTGPEATDLMNAEQVRLMKLWMNHQKVSRLPASNNIGSLFDFELPFLHPVQELIIVIRKVSEMSNDTAATSALRDSDQKASTKNRFAFHGGGKNPNIESFGNSVYDGSGGVYQKNIPVVAAAAEDTSGTTTIPQVYPSEPCDDTHLIVDSFKLTLNGQERHPSLAANGLDRRYLMERVMPQLHSNTSTKYGQLLKLHSETQNQLTQGHKHGVATVTRDHALADFRHLEQMLDRKEIYVYPFCVNPEGSNPSGAVNFSKVSHAKLGITGRVVGNSDVQWQCDVYAVYYNWLSIKDGRAVTSFA